MVLGFFIGFMCIPNDPFWFGLLQFNRAVSMIFLIYQALIFLAVGYIINDFLRATCGDIVLLVLTVIFVAGNITWTVFQFLNYTATGCTANLVFQIILIVMAVAGLVIVPF
jgi:hypothetical protein